MQVLARLQLAFNEVLSLSIKDKSCRETFVLHRYAKDFPFSTSQLLVTACLLEVATVAEQHA